MEIIKEHACHDGRMVYYCHQSEAVKGEMKFGVYYPPQMKEGAKLPALTYLAGLTCNEETFLIKGGAQQYAAQHGIILVAPDTSPRGAGVEGEDDNWDFGTGAGFYINATNGPWAKNYRMEAYVTDELQLLMKNDLNVDVDRQGIFGHSMGGHGALTLGLKYPEVYKSISAFAPICAPTKCPWGEKAFSGYIGDDKAEWAKHDTVELVRASKQRHHKPVLVDQGLNDEFLNEQLNPDLLEQACNDTNYPLTLRRHPGYDHSYYFMNTFMKDHVDHHAKVICS
ncbi:MAG: S-formylglutathione hydrolase [Rhodospirillales bacterium]|nr:S-formylglutathione hydrolase [Rhodospirillales bacterium]